ncbi:MAG: hypothetical protein GY895_08875 [Phycisphaera sp.]|nr:hypothetical protein [Phycisphaera sp.]
MYCRSCRYGLEGLDAGRCPECGVPFDPTDPSTYAEWRYKPQALIGTAAAIGIFLLSIIVFFTAMQPSYGHSQDAAFFTLAGIGVVLGGLAAILAGWLRWWLGQIPLLLVGVFCTWAGLFLASSHGYSVWQGGPNPPDEAFADTAPIGFLLAGWIPAGVLVGLVFGVALLFFRRQRRSRRPRPAGQ